MKVPRLAKRWLLPAGIAALLVSSTAFASDERVSETGYIPAPIVTPEPPFTIGESNTIMWPRATFPTQEGADGKPPFRRHFVLEINDVQQGTSKVVDVPGGETATGYRVVGSQFPTSLVDGHTFKYRLKMRWRQCVTATVGHYCTTHSDYDSFYSTPVVSTQDATPPVLTRFELAGSGYSNTLRVRAFLDARDPGQHPSGIAFAQFSSDSAFPCAKLGLCGTPFAADTVVNLRPGPDGPRTVYSRVFDGAQAPGAVARSAGVPFGVPAANASQTASETIVLDTTGPKLVIMRTPEPQKAGKPVTFDGSQSIDAGGLNADSGVDAGTAVWDFGDGTKASGLAASHVYTTAGSYTATLTMSDKAGNASRLSVKTTIMPSDWGGKGAPTQTAGTPTASPSQTDTTAPTLSAVRLTRLRGRLRLGVVLSEAATLIVQMERMRPRPRTLVAARSPSVAAGRRTLLLARMQRRARYRILIAARDSAGNASPTRVVFASGPRR